MNILLLLSSLLLAAVLVPAPAAADCVLPRQGLVCTGEPWCTPEMCGVPICVRQSGPCVNGPPEEYPANCLVRPATGVGFVCFGEPWCSPEMCGIPVCLTNGGKLCVNEGPP